MSLTKIAQKNENQPVNSALIAWKKEFFGQLHARAGSDTVFLRLDTQYAQKKAVHHQLVPTLGWKVELTGFQGESAAQLSELRRELTATLKVNGIHVVHKKDEWMRYLKEHHEVGASYAKLCGAC